MRSLVDKGSKNIQELLHMFRVSPTDLTGQGFYKNSRLYLQCVTADKVTNILKQSNPKTLM